MHIFISELRYAIKFEVLAFRSIDLNDAIELAYLQKSYWTQISPFPELLPIIQALNFLVIPISPSFSTTSSMLISSSSSHGPSASVPGVGCVPYKKLTPAKMQQKREFNLCYNCDDKWHKNHHCSFTPNSDFTYPKMMLWNTHVLKPTQPLRSRLLLLVLRRHHF